LTWFPIDVNFPFVPNYNAMIAEFQQELDCLVDQRDLINRQIASIVKAMDAIKTLAEETTPSLDPPPMPPDEQEGFTNRVRGILKANPAMAVTPVMIRDVFRKHAPKDDPKTLLIHTHNTLKRLHKQGEIEEIVNSEGRAYRWKATNINTGADVMEYLRGLTEPGKGVKSAGSADAAMEALKQTFVPSKKK
jgi:hypothetical protein